MADIKLIYSNAKPEKPRKIRQLPKVSPYCPLCNSNAWITINLGPANMEGMKATKGSIVIIKIYTYQSGEMLIKYGVSVYAGTRDYNEYELFKTKRDLLNSL